MSLVMPSYQPPLEPPAHYHFPTASSSSFSTNAEGLRTLDTTIVSARRHVLPGGLGFSLASVANHIQDRDLQVKQAFEAHIHGSLTQRSTSAPIRPTGTCMLACKLFLQPFVAFLTREGHRRQKAVRAQPKMLSQIFPGDT